MVTHLILNTINPKFYIRYRGIRSRHRQFHPLEGADAAAPGLPAGAGGAGRHLLRHLRLLPPGQPGNRHGPCHGPVLCEHPGQHHGGSGIPQIHHPLRLRRRRGHSGRRQAEHCLCPHRHGPLRRRDPHRLPAIPPQRHPVDNFLQSGKLLFETLR